MEVFFKIKIHIIKHNTEELITETVRYCENQEIIQSLLDILSLNEEVRGNIVKLISQEELKMFTEKDVLGIELIIDQLRKNNQL